MIRFRFEWMLFTYVIIKYVLTIDIEQAIATLNAALILTDGVCMSLNVCHEFVVRFE